MYRIDEKKNRIVEVFSVQNQVPQGFINMYNSKLLNLEVETYFKNNKVTIADLKDSKKRHEIYFKIVNSKRGKNLSFTSCYAYAAIIYKFLEHLNETEFCDVFCGQADEKLTGVYSHCWLIYKDIILDWPKATGANIPLIKLNKNEFIWEPLK